MTGTLSLQELFCEKTDSYVDHSVSSHLDGRQSHDRLPHGIILMDTIQTKAFDR
jgi:hypothetical protein